RGTPGAWAGFGETPDPRVPPAGGCGGSMRGTPEPGPRTPMPADASDHERLYENKLDRSGRDALKRSFQISRGVAKRNSKVLYAGMCRIPEPKRSAMFSLYAWRRRIDNAADLDGIVESRRVEVHRLREMTDR